MQNQFENHQFVMHNDQIDRFKSLVFLKENNILVFLKENNISLSILQYNSTLFAEFIVHFFKDWRKYLFYLLIEETVLMSKTS